MTKHFYTAAGNSFIILEDCPYEEGSKEMILAVKALCTEYKRDGIIVAEIEDPSKGGPMALPRMIFYNPDGTSGMMCGNGGRCFVEYLINEKKIKDSEGKVLFRAADGLHMGWVNEGPSKDGEVSVSLSMQNVEFIDFFPEDFGDGKKELKTKYDKYFYGGTYLETGAPHLVFHLRDEVDLDSFDVQKVGSYYRNMNVFPEGTNVDFVHELDLGEIAIRTFERGVEGETLACGTGVVAAALDHAYDHMAQGEGEVLVHAREADFIVSFNAREVFEDVFLTGPVKKC